MKFSTVVALTLPALSLVSAAKCSAGHRRHHNRLSSAKKGSSSSSSSTSGYAYSSKKSKSSSSKSSGSSKNSTSSASSSSGVSFPGLMKGAVAIGMHVDDGGSGGAAETMAQVNSRVGSKMSLYGYYAQIQQGVPFDGQQLLYRLDDIVNSGAIFQPAVMPLTWQGLTHQDNSQAVAVAKVMKKFQDAGVKEIWLRFAHEVNWYQQDGTYQGDANDFKEGWAVMAAAIKQHAPGVKMFFTPNIADESQYDEYYPDDASTVDMIGIDYYPSSAQSGDFVAKMKPFHDKYTNDRVFFAIGETGLGQAADMSQRLAWAKDILSDDTASAMPNLKALTWFNYIKGYNFKIVNTDNDSEAVAFFKK